MERRKDIIMSVPLPKRPVRGRSAKQERSGKTRGKIAAAAVEVIADHGIAGLTHRLVADRAGVSLAATTYYYKGKFDILAEASNASMQRYSTNFERVLARSRSGRSEGQTFRGFAIKLLKNVADIHRSGTIAWAEISLDAVRHPESLVLSRGWMTYLKALWTDIADAMGVSDAQEAARSGIDTTIGLIFITLALGLSEHDLEAVIEGSANPVTAWGDLFDRTGFTSSLGTEARSKAQDTRKRIVEAAVEVLVTDGPAAINFRRIARRIGLTAAAPGYHFSTVEKLLRLAQAELFENSKQRYRNAVSTNGQHITDLEQLVELTSVVFQREATESGRHNLAAFSIWLEAARRPELRPMIWSAVADQCVAWTRILSPLSPSITPLHGLLAQAVFAGKLIRLLSSGAATADLVGVRREFLRDMAALVDGTFWILPNKNSTHI